MRIIEDWWNKNLRCHFCGEIRSVKYEKEVFDPVVSNKPTKVCVCNKCVLRFKDIFEKGLEHLEELNL